MADLQAILTELSELQTAKRQALAKMDIPALEQIVESEAGLGQRLSEAAESRAGLLATLGVGPTSSRSLRQVLQKIPHPGAQRVAAELASLREQARDVQQSLSGNFLAAYRTAQHVSDLMQLIANAGRPTTGRVVHGGGLMLDNRA